MSREYISKSSMCSEMMLLLLASITLRLGNYSSLFKLVSLLLDTLSTSSTLSWESLMGRSVMPKPERSSDLSLPRYARLILSSMSACDILNLIFNDECLSR